MLHADPEGFHGRHYDLLLRDPQNLVRLDALMNCLRMSFKPKNSRSLSIRKGKLDEDFCFKVANQEIPRISQEPVKSIGRWYGSFLNDTKCGYETLEQDWTREKYKVLSKELEKAGYKSQILPIEFGDRDLLEHQPTTL
ncbi:reverse transcriptase [Plakobranchus ocellatus]|uniref:Reverse transcriptase n=1 Tax=Plakobranchus ocellatus TaxID=259542 RepID=A0AAV3Y590_9GAST|nr:reverse transcriptase [Plakobranchus ocellatus]